MAAPAAPEIEPPMVAAGAPYAMAVPGAADAEPPETWFANDPEMEPPPYIAPGTAEEEPPVAYVVPGMLVVTAGAAYCGATCCCKPVVIAGAPYVGTPVGAAVVTVAPPCSTGRSGPTAVMVTCSAGCC